MRALLTIAGFAALLIGCASSDNSVAANDGMSESQAVSYAWVQAMWEADGDKITKRVAPKLSEFRRCMSGDGKATVYLTLDVSPRGLPSNVNVSDTTNACFNESAVNAVERWRFSPYVHKGFPVTVTDVTTTVEYLWEDE